MSLGGEDLKKTEELPGAFPSEDAVTTTTVAGAQQNTKPYPEHNLSAHQNVAQAGGANNSGVPPQSQNIVHTTAAGSESTASPADSDPDHLLRRAGAEGKPVSQTTSSRIQDDRESAKPSSLASAANPLSGPAVADDDGFGPDNAPDITEDLKAVGSGAATAATAAAIAARDAAVAVKDAAAPMVSAASERAMQAAGYAAENAGPAANAAVNTVQANAPSVLRGGTTAANTASPRDVAPEVPGQVKSSIAEAGEAPEAAASRRAVHDKGQVEGELLGHAAEADAEENEVARRAQQQQQPVKKGPRPPPPGGALPRLDSGPLTPSTGVAVVLGTDTERSFPLGSHPVHHGDENGAEQEKAAHSGGPLATDGLRTGGVPQTSSGGREAAARRLPPAEDKVPVRTTEEQAVGNGSDAYKTLSSGTPSGLGQ